MKIISCTPRRKALPICIDMTQTGKQNVGSLKLRIFTNRQTLNKWLFLTWAKNYLIVLNFLLKRSKEIWKKTEGIHQHNHFIREKTMYYISFSTILDKRWEKIGFQVVFFFQSVLYGAVGFGVHLILLFRVTSTAVRVIFDVTKSGEIKVKS